MSTGKKKSPDLGRLDRVVADARRAQEERAQSYRGRALKMFPWICGRCTRQFTTANVQELTVHHKDHNHDNNPPDGSNWELLCLYCHDNEHQRHLGQPRLFGGKDESTSNAIQTPFADLASLLNKNK